MSLELCPGPDRASECESRACRYGGCQGRMPGKSRRKRQPYRAKRTLRIAVVESSLQAIIEPEWSA